MTQLRVIWIAIPRGLANGSDRLRLSVVPLLHPEAGAAPHALAGLARLDDFRARLDEFPALLDWPDRIVRARFVVRFHGGPSLTEGQDAVTRAPGIAADWRAEWQRWFPAHTEIQPAPPPPSEVRVFPRDELARVELAQAGERVSRWPAASNEATAEAQKLRRQSRDWAAAQLAAQQMEERFDPRAVAPPVLFDQRYGYVCQYPELMRRLGLLIELEVPAQGVPAGADEGPQRTVQVEVLLDGPGLVPVSPPTAYQLVPGSLFLAQPSSPGSSLHRGALRLDKFRVTQSNADDLAVQQQGASDPALLRSTGLSLVRTAAEAERQLEEDGKRAGALADLVHGEAPPVLWADDLMSGYRLDVWHSRTGRWHSLCERQVSFAGSGGEPLDLKQDEGYLSHLAVSRGLVVEGDKATPVTLLDRALARWSGWSLVVPRPGKAVDNNNRAVDLTTESGGPLPRAKVKVPPGSLPRLRFGDRYRLRLRAVDLAGHSIPLETPPEPETQSEEVCYVRYEPAKPPLVVATPDQVAGSPGESLLHLVVRTWNDAGHAPRAARRHIFPPRAAVNMAEAHGMFDTGNGGRSMNIGEYNTICKQDEVALRDEAVPTPTGLIPYLSDPAVKGAALRHHDPPGAQPEPLRHVDFLAEGHVWPAQRIWTKSFALELRGAEGAPPLAQRFSVEPFREQDRTLVVRVPQGERVTLDLSSTLRPSEAAKLGLWFDHHEPLVLSGGHPMLTPPRQITLVHAVQRPVAPPDLRAPLAPIPPRRKGETAVVHRLSVRAHRGSTAQVDIHARWDVLGGKTGGDATPRHAVIGTVRLGGADDCTDPADPRFVGSAAITMQHSLGDTRHHLVRYQPVAVSSFREYFPPLASEEKRASDGERARDAAHYERAGEEVCIHVDSTARPPALSVAYALPAFQTVEEPGRSVRRGRCLRVYLRGPWFQSGEGEELAVVLAPPGGAPPAELAKQVSCWGADPAWAPAGLTPLAAANLPGGRPIPATVQPEAPGTPVVLFSYPVSYDKTLERYFADIEFAADAAAPGAYFPFVRLVLSRYQPHSLPGLELSPVTPVDFVQFGPERVLSLVPDPRSGGVGIVLQGDFPAPERREIDVALLRHDGRWGAEDRWVPCAAPIQLVPADGSAQRWQGAMPLPDPAQPHRLLVHEYEIIEQDGGSNGRRLIYAGMVTLGR